MGDLKLKSKMKKLKIENLHIENDVVNGSPKLILTDENGEEWVMSSVTTSNEGCARPHLCKKKDDWYFKKQQ